MSKRFNSFCRSVLCAAVLTAAHTSLAQPTVDADLGRFDDVADRSFQQFVITTPANPVRWYSATLPRVADPHRLLDIFTWGTTAYDTEVGLFAADGTLIANDDDDGASNFSAITFGITNTAAPGRVHPTTAAGQTPGVPNDGRDGSFSGAAPGPTAATYYIAVTEYDAAFANNFSVTRTGAASGVITTLVVNCRTPGGFTPTSMNIYGSPDWKLGSNGDLVLEVLGPVASVAADTTEVGGSSNVPLTYDDPFPNYWGRFIPVSGVAVGPKTIPVRVTTPIGDVVVGLKAVNVRPPAYYCGDASDRAIAPQPGTNTYTYDTTFGNVDGPWNNCSPFTPSGDDVWFGWEATQSGTATVSTCNSDTGVVGDQPDTLLGVRLGCFVPAFVACGDDTAGCGYGTRLTNVPINEGSQYNIAVRAYSGSIVNGTLAVIFTPTPSGCDTIDFNGDGLFPDTDDIAHFIAVFGGAPCPTGTCGDIDFNNDGLFPDTDDITALIRVFGGGPCL